MAYRHLSDQEMDQSTNKVMAIGGVLMVLMIIVFPLYRLIEPTNRTEARDAQEQSLAQEGESIWGFNCSSCHGTAGEGGVGPALNSKQFLQSASDEQIRTIVSVGVPGSLMSAFSLDFSGPLTSEQIKAVVTYLRSWEDEAPDRPDWRDPTP